MSGRRTDSPVVAWLQAQLMQPAIYGGSVPNQAWNPLEWLPLGLPDPPPLLALLRPILVSVPRDYPGAGFSKMDFSSVLMLTCRPQGPSDLFPDSSP
jgi:hypothetical protein